MDYLNCTHITAKYNIHNITPMFLLVIIFNNLVMPNVIPKAIDIRLLYVC